MSIFINGKHLFHVKFLKLYLRLCDKIPRDAVAHLGFRVGNGVIYHIVRRPGGIHVAAARCDECLFYKLMTRSYVLGTPMIIDGRLRVIVADTHAVRRLLGEHISQVIKAEPLSPADVTLTKRQREVLSALANGHNISSAARESAVSKVAVYKTFKKTLRKLTQLIS
jgi:hypothetical protein